MVPLLFLGLAVTIPLLGLAVIFLVNWLRRERWEDGIKAFEQRRSALADASSARFKREPPSAT